MKRPILFLCLWMASGVMLSAFTSPVTLDNDGQEPICYWQLTDTSEALSGGSDGTRSASRNGNSINTSYTVSGSENCGSMTFYTNHTWTDPGYYLTPGEILTFSVEASWSANGPSSCQSMSTGVNTWIAAGATTIKARQGQIIVSTEPSGGVSNSGEWSVPGGSEGNTLSIRAHGEQGGAGGTVFYTYTYVCEAPPEPTGNCLPNVSNISGLEPGDVLSPAVDFVDEEGNTAGVIGSVWYINGKQTPSVVWDGNEAVLELQYTCMDHSGHSKTIVIPAYNGTAVSGQQQDDKSADQTGKKNALPAAGAAAGLAAGAAGAGAAGKALLKKKPKPQRKKADKQPKKGNNKEKKVERKSLLDSEKDAIEKYGESLQKMSAQIERALDMIDDIPGLSPSTKKRMKEQLEKFKDSLDKVSEISGSLTEKLEKLQNMRDTLQEIGSKYRQLQKSHMQALKELKDLPEGAANQLADLTTAIEGIGMAADSVFKRIPYFKHIYSEEYFQTMESFSQFSKGLRKNLSKTVFRTAVEGKKELTLQERRAFGERGVDYKKDPQVQKLIKERLQREAKEYDKSIFKKVSDLFFGKDVPPHVKSMR